MRAEERPALRLYLTYRLPSAACETAFADFSCGSSKVNVPGKEIKMKYICDVCGWEYDEQVGDPDNGIAPGTKFEDLPENFTCPLCGVGKDNFSAVE